MNTFYTWYVAAPWAEREAARAARQAIIASGHTVKSRWLDFEKDESDIATLRQEALNDLEDIVNADGLILLNTQRRGEETSGKAVEMGFAMGLLKPIILVGEPTNVFHHLDIPTHSTIDEALAWINGEEGHGFVEWVLRKRLEHFPTTYVAEGDEPVEVLHE